MRNLGIIFNTYRSGALHRVKTFLSLGEHPDKVNLKLPCWISVEGRKKIVVTAVDGLPDSVKEDMGWGGFNVTVATHVGDYKTPLLSGEPAFIGQEQLTEIVSFLRSSVQPVKAVDEEGILAANGISHLVLVGVSEEPDQQRPGVIHVSLACFSELLPDVGAVELLTSEEY